MTVSMDYLNTLGAGSGLDTQAIVTAMVEAAKANKQSTIDRRTVAVTADISSMAKVKSALMHLRTAFATLNDAHDFHFSSVSNSGSSYVKTTLDGNVAQTGSYNIQVNRLAKAQVPQSHAFAAVTADLSPAEAVDFTITVGSGAVHTVSLAAGEVTLAKAAEAINDLGIGVSAWVVQTDTEQYQLLLQGPTGAANALTINDPDDLFGFNAEDAIVQQAEDAEVVVNGVRVTRATNAIHDVIPGLHMDLQNTSAASFNVSVLRDPAAAQAAITDLVAAVNAFEAIMEEVTAVKDANGDAGPLKDDTGIKTIRDQLRDIFMAASSTPGDTVKSLSSMGISIQRTGDFAVNDLKLATALKDHFNDIVQLFSANTNDHSSYGVSARGLAGDMVKAIDDYLAFDGLIQSRENAYSDIQSTLQTEQTVLDKRMSAIEERYTKEFIAMNKIMDEMKNMQKYLENQLENLPFTAGNK